MKNPNTATAEQAEQPTDYKTAINALAGETCNYIGAQGAKAACLVYDATGEASELEKAFQELGYVGFLLHRSQAEGTEDRPMSRVTAAAKYFIKVLKPLLDKENAAHAAAAAADDTAPQA